MELIQEVIYSSQIKELKQIMLDTFDDDRGEIWTIHSEEYCDYKFVADKMTISKYGVLRGLHADSHTAKLISCLHGTFQFVVADLRRDSPTYGNSESYILSRSKPSVVVVPPGCANAHLCLTDECIFYYKWSAEYNGPESQVTVAWDDPDLNINWLNANPILSERDQNGVLHKEIRL